MFLLAKRTRGGKKKGNVCGDQGCSGGTNTFSAVRVNDE